MVVNGLPAHPLLVHLVVVLLPLMAFAAIVVTLWPAAQRKLTFLVPLGAIVGLALVPLTVAAGRDLEAKLPATVAIQKHANVGGMVLPWAIGLAVATLAQWLYLRQPDPRRELSLAVGALAVATAAGTLTVVVLTGGSGTQAVWGSR